MLVRIALAFVLAGLMLYGASAQTTRSSSGDEAILALVSELRAVRSDLADASQRTLRFQLLLARLQLQEQRIGHLDRQRAEIIKTLLDTQSVSTMFAAQFAQMERGCQDAPPEERKACESQLSTMKATVGTHQVREQQLRLQEQDLNQAIAAEQGRWSEFSVRLDELERALAKPR